jgi:hypothetical protein
MSTQTPLSLFVNQLNSLCCELADMYPEDVDIKMAKTSIDTMKRMNPKMVFTTFHQFVYPFKDQILSRNEDFFLNMDFSNIAGSEANNMMTVMNLKKYWSTMTEQTKECMWQYFGVLVKLCEKINP